MPDSFDRETLIDRATDALNGGDAEGALAIAEEIRAGEGPNADEALIRGIALSSLGRSAPASDAFAEAMRRAPGSHKARFNAAVHEFNAGNAAGARELAAEAARLDPQHGGTRDLLGKIEATLNPGAGGSSSASSASASPVEPPALSSAEYAAYARPGMPGATGGGSGAEEENLPWIGRLGPAWTAIGVGILILGSLAFAITTALSFRYMPSLAAVNDPGAGFSAGLRASQQVQRDPLGFVAGIVGFFTNVATILWTVLDLVRRRGNFVWLVGVIPLSCLSLGWIIVPIYLLAGRKGPSAP